MNAHHASLLPFARSYWVVPGQLLGGFFPGDRDPAVAQGKLNALLQCGVTHIVNLMPASDRDHAGRPFLEYEAEFHRLAAEHRRTVTWTRRPIVDLDVPGVAQMTDILNGIDSAISCGGCVYVHCWGGRGRTGTVLGCWLARHGERDPLARLKDLTTHAPQWFGRVPETAEQRAFVRNWKAGK